MPIDDRQGSTASLFRVNALQVANLSPGQLVKIGTAGILQSSPQPFINAADYGAKGDLVYAVATSQTVTAVSGADDTTAIQNALTAAGASVSSVLTTDLQNYQGNIICFIPQGNYKITSTLVVPPNVVIWSEGWLFNFLSSTTAPIIQGSRHSHAKKIQVHCNGQGGINWGDGSAGLVSCASNLEHIVIWNAGTDYNSSLASTQQKCGLRLSGLDFRIGHLWIQGGNIGLHGYQATSVMTANCFIKGSFTGIAIELCDNWGLPSISWDTNINTNITIDNSNNLRIHGRAFVNNDNYGTPQQAGVIVGKNTTKPCTNLFIDYTAQSTGGYGLQVSNTQDCKIRLTLTNSRTSLQTGIGKVTKQFFVPYFAVFSYKSQALGAASSHWTSTSGTLLPHNIGTNYQYNGGTATESAAAAIQYGTGLSGYLDIEIIKDDAIALYQGTQYGDVRSYSEIGFIRLTNGANTTPINKKFIYYEQQAIPVAPSLGDIWIERDSNNVPVQQWFWNGTYWLSIQDYLATTSFPNSTVPYGSSIEAGIGVLKNTNIYLLENCLSFQYLESLHSTINYLFPAFTYIISSGGSNYYYDLPFYSTQALNIKLYQAVVMRTTVNQYYAVSNSPTEFYCGISAYGTSQNLRQIGAYIKYKLAK